MINDRDGTPVIGYVSLTNGAPGPVNIALFTLMGQAAVTLQPAAAGGQAAERVYITNITVSSSDTNAAIPLITIDSGGTTPTKYVSAYVNNTHPLQPVQIPPGLCRGIPGIAPRATASTVTAATTVEVVIKGYISRT